MDYCSVHCPVCNKYIDEPTALYCSPKCRRAEEAPLKPRTQAAPTVRRITIPRSALELSTLRPHPPSTSQSPTIPSFPSRRLVRNPCNHSSPEELAYDMAHVAETQGDALPTPVPRTSSPPTSAQPGPTEWIAKNDNSIMSWVIDVNNHRGVPSDTTAPPSTTSLDPAVRQYTLARYPLPSPVFAISACRLAPPTLSTAGSDFDELFVPSSRGTVSSSHVLDDSSTSIITSAVDEEFSSDGFDDDNLTNPSSVSASLNEKYGDTTGLAVQLQTWMAPSTSPSVPVPMGQPPVRYGHPRRISHHPSQSNPLDLTSFSRARAVDAQPLHPRKPIWHLDSRTRTTSRTTSRDSSYESCDEVESRVRMVQGRRHSSVTAGMRLVEILEGAGAKGPADPDALWSSRGRMHGRLCAVPR